MHLGLSQAEPRREYRKKAIAMDQVGDHISHGNQRQCQVVVGRKRAVGMLGAQVQAQVPKAAPHPVATEQACGYRP
ncbi:hypothetical protein D3C81_1952710 [compost metagenome]